ncbi:hypothetical protein JCGZ_18598 [Jatropha curcas]|uniref:Uncharacterized protein n=1 Tax=Jatropha curcas TaxID=180498 RepID=A0A067KE07_JATCU|nr:hypothetical protein JCGZ_18598 [Jatropha curcas]
MDPGDLSKIGDLLVPDRSYTCWKRLDHLRSTQELSCSGGAVRSSGGAAGGATAGLTDLLLEVGGALELQQD